MGKTAFIFPGQGSQYAGMGRDLAGNFDVARQAFDEADAALGFEISRLCFDGPEEDLQLTANTQPAILTASIAAYRVLQSHGVHPDFVAGHSLGEYSALVAAGALSLGDAVRLVRRRGELMQEAAPEGAGAMAAILGLDASAVADACIEAAGGEVCAPANFNTPTQTVIAGNTVAVERAVEACKQRGARRAVMLKVSAPFHCALMRPAQEAMTAPLSGTHFNALPVPLVNNVDAAFVTSGDAAREGLIRQISSPVRWTETIAALVSSGATTFVEVGPGKVLSGLVRAIDRDVRLLNVEDTASLTAAIEALKQES
ncbi:MAG: ACP S-malonyltransferase [Acidobacteria bacterium]|nr:ACP S-malonyltransferase [Acidobacteriota bacterium]MCW5971413.1 ACP S-malonyltransferase [Blastocatellales bacterium]